MDVGFLVFGPAQHYRQLRVVELIKAREKLGLSQTAFALRCGWTAQEQSRIESKRNHDISSARAMRILIALREGPGNHNVIVE